MDSPWGLLLVNKTVTELEEKLIRKLVEDGTIKFHERFADDTFVVNKPKDIVRVHQALNNFHKNQRFTIDTFDNVVHLLNLEIVLLLEPRIIFHLFT